VARPVIEVKGVRELRRSMRKAGEDLSQMNRANQAVSGFVAARAAGSAPRRSGRLAGSLRGSGGRTAAIVRAGGAKVPYASPIHWGWPRRNIRAQPWISEAATSTESTWLGMYADAIEQILNKVKGA
jgi:hypothetical protein